MKNLINKNVILIGLATTILLSFVAYISATKAFIDNQTEVNEPYIADIPLLSREEIRMDHNIRFENDESYRNTLLALEKDGKIKLLENGSYSGTLSIPN